MIWKISKTQALIALLVIASLYFRIIEINRPLWSDELITTRTTDINPLLNPLYNGISTNLPLFYYLVKIFEIITLDGINLRYLNVLIYVITILFVYKKYEYLSQTTKSVLLLFLAVSPLQIYYSIELRTYALAQLLLIINFYYFQKKDLNIWFWLTAYLLTLTHYSCYVYLLGIFIFYLITNKSNWNHIYKFVFLGFFGLSLTYLISKNQGFADSTSTSVLSNNFSRFTLNNLIENLLRLREVISVYFNFGLHYYRVENEFLSLIKKLTQILTSFYIVYIFYNYRKNKEKIFNVLLIALLMNLAILLDLAGIMPFGGRYVFPFHFFFLILLGYCFEVSEKISKYLSYTLITIFLLSYLSYDYCLSVSLDIFRGNNDPQGSLYQKCVEQVSKNK
jgi:hypothetical protein